MPVQAIRLANLQALIQSFEHLGVTGRDAQAALLGCATTGFKLQSMLEGTPVPALFASRVEHSLCKPRGWLDEQHLDQSDAFDVGPFLTGRSDCLCDRAALNQMVDPGSPDSLVTSNIATPPICLPPAPYSGSASTESSDTVPS